MGASTVPAIIKKFDVVAYAEDGAAVIDVTGLFMDDVPEFSPKVQLRDVQRMDRSRSFFTSVKAFPHNVETRVLATFSRSPRNPFQERSGRTPAPRRSDGTLGSVTIELHHSMVKLPDEPMMPRNFDARVGFFSLGYEDYSSDSHEVDNVRYVTRWRLEKQDPDAAMSDPVNPIVYYIGRGIPEKWRSYMAAKLFEKLQGVENRLMLDCGCRKVRAIAPAGKRHPLECKVVRFTRTGGEDDFLRPRTNQCGHLSPCVLDRFERPFPFRAGCLRIGKLRAEPGRHRRLDGRRQR